MPSENARRDKALEDIARELHRIQKSIEVLNHNLVAIGQTIRAAAASMDQFTEVSADGSIGAEEHGIRPAHGNL